VCSARQGLDMRLLGRQLYGYPVWHNLLVSSGWLVPVSDLSYDSIVLNLRLLYSGLVTSLRNMLSKWQFQFSIPRTLYFVLGSALVSYLFPRYSWVSFDSSTN
jgi:hypothetical protein